MFPIATTPVVKATIPHTSNGYLLHTSQDHYNNWPNDKGFNPEFERREPVELKVEGQIPPYAVGTLYRTGPGKSQVETDAGDTYHVSHWFDGFSETHRFQILAPDASHPNLRVFYNSRFSTDAMIEEARKTGCVDKLSFGQKRDPCKTYFQKVQSEFEKPDPSSVNIGVTLSVNVPGWSSLDASTGIKTLHVKTDRSATKQLDPETLEPIGLASQKNLHPDLSGPRAASHARSDPVTGDFFNYNLAVEPQSAYRVFTISATTGKTSILATIPAPSAYLHSLLLTEDYVLLCVWNCHIDESKVLNSSFVDAMLPFDPSLKAKWYVVDRKGGKGLVATYETLPFFCFHTVNAWQEPSKDDECKTDIVAELVMYKNLDILKKLYYETLISNSPGAKALLKGKTDSMRSSFARFRLPAIPTSQSSEILQANLEWAETRQFSPDLPTLHPACATKPHRYTYAVTDRDESTFFDGLVKFDSVTKETMLWKRHGHSPGEAIFVADPNGTEEDSGVLLSVVLDGTSGKSYLLCLDAKDMTELGRAHVDGVVGFGFHGIHVRVGGNRSVEF